MACLDSPAQLILLDPNSHNALFFNVGRENKEISILWELKSISIPLKNALSYLNQG